MVRREDNRPGNLAQYVEPADLDVRAEPRKGKYESTLSHAANESRNTAAVPLDEFQRFPCGRWPGDSIRKIGQMPRTSEGGFVDCCVEALLQFNHQFHLLEGSQPEFLERGLGCDGSARSITTK